MNVMSKLGHIAPRGLLHVMVATLALSLAGAVPAVACRSADPSVHAGSLADHAASTESADHCRGDSSPPARQDECPCCDTYAGLCCIEGGPGRIALSSTPASEQRLDPPAALPVSPPHDDRGHYRQRRTVRDHAPPPLRPDASSILRL